MYFVFLLFVFLLSGCTSITDRYSLISMDVNVVSDRKNSRLGFSSNHDRPSYDVKSGDSSSAVREQFERESTRFSYSQAEVIDEDSYALIIGINEYSDNPDVNHADFSALAFEILAIKTLGVPKENVITMINSRATSGRIKSNIELIKELPENSGKLYVFFAGHGVPGKDGNVYLLPSDMSADSIHLEPKLRLDNIIHALASSDASYTYVFLDSCFSGRDDVGDLLYKGVAPVLKVNRPKVPKKKITVMTAGRGTDFANDFEEKRQRLFSYYLISELASGEKDLEKIYNSVRKKVKRQSLKKGIGYKQVPDLYGEKDMVAL